MSIFSSLFGMGVKTEDLKSMVQNGALIIDVRTPDEFRSGHIPQSQNIPLQQLEQKLASIKQKNNAVITVCQSGARSGMATTILKKAGVEVVNGGGWSSLQNKLR